MGADSFLGLGTWHRADEVPFAATLIVASRPGQPLEDLEAALPAGLTIRGGSEPGLTQGGVEVRAFELRNQAGQVAELYLLPGLDVPVSASEIRARIRDQDKQTASSKPALLSQSVLDYVHQRGLYR
jgi:nicotinate-nucleotide adenylyltransferase